eukprot:5572559-Prorocentrum_lima.AAC.1
MHNRLVRQLSNLDAVVHMIRHLTSVRAAKMIQDTQDSSVSIKPGYHDPQESTSDVGSGASLPEGWAPTSLETALGGQTNFAPRIHDAWLVL